MEEKNPRGRPAGKKTVTHNKAEIRQIRQESIKQIFNNHLSHTEFIKWCGKKYDLSRARCNKYWTGSWNTVEEKFKLEKDKLITKHLNAYWDLYQESKIKGDINTARQVLNDLARMGGLNEPDKVDMNLDHEITFRFGDED